MQYLTKIVITRPTHIYLNEYGKAKRISSKRYTEICDACIGIYKDEGLTCDSGIERRHITLIHHA